MKKIITPTDDLPLWIEVDLDALGVRKPKPNKPAPSPKTADHEPWTPSFKGEDPPF